jgi:hypothetical protein
MSKFLIDYNFGLKKEVEILEIIKKYFNDDTIIKLNKYNVFDFKGISYYELKSRNNEYNKYSSTMIGNNKIIKASQLDDDVYFLFSFTDGLYYWKYDKNYKLEIKKCGRIDRGIAEINDYAFIPIEILIKIV